MSDGNDRLDYSIDTLEGRAQEVKKIVENTPPQYLSNKFLNTLSDYIFDSMDKQARKGRTILTDNRMVTINKRETSYEGLVTKLENGENGIYNMTSDLGKNVILQPKNKITDADVAEVPGLSDLQQSIQKVQKLCRITRGRRRYLLKKQLIEMRQDQYVLRDGWQKPAHSLNTVRLSPHFKIQEEIVINADNLPQDTKALVTFFNPTHVSEMLCHYGELKSSAQKDFQNDNWYLVEDFDNLLLRLKQQYPAYYDLAMWKISGYKNVQIQKFLADTHGITHSVEYLSFLWRNKIPKIIVRMAQQEYLIWYYTTQEYGKWKKCSQCGQIKLAHSLFFSKNKSSKDGWYSMCKLCRNKKNKKGDK